MVTKQRIKELEAMMRKLPDEELIKVARLFARALVQCGAGVSSSCDGEPLTDEEYQWLLSRLNRIKNGTC